MDVNRRPEDFSDPQLADAIAWLAERERNAEAANLRRERLRRQFVAALNDRQRQDPTLAKTGTVTVS